VNSRHRIEPNASYRADIGNDMAVAIWELSSRIPLGQSTRAQGLSDPNRNQGDGSPRSVASVFRAKMAPPDFATVAFPPDRSFRLGDRWPLIVSLSVIQAVAMRDRRARTGGRLE